MTAVLPDGLAVRVTPARGRRRGAPSVGEDAPSGGGGSYAPAMKPTLGLSAGAIST